MPLYEFRCLKCQELFELLVMRQDEEMAMQCPHCGEADFERVMSTASYAVGSSGGTGGGASANTRQCAGGSCTTYDIPGPA